MRPSTPFTVEKSFYLLSCVLIFVLLFIKAKTMSMTHDESSSFFYLNDKNVFFDLFDKNAWPNANNHWLNTILFQISSRLFGPSELAIRLPHVLSFILYADFTIKLIDLGIELKKEIISHKNTWKKRYKVYQFMYNDIGMIDYRLKELVHHGLNHKKEMLVLSQKKYLQIEELNG